MGSSNCKMAMSLLKVLGSNFGCFTIRTTARNSSSSSLTFSRSCPPSNTWIDSVSNLIVMKKIAVPCDSYYPWSIEHFWFTRRHSGQPWRHICRWWEWHRNRERLCREGRPSMGSRRLRLDVRRRSGARPFSRCHKLAWRKTAKVMQERKQ